MNVFAKFDGIPLMILEVIIRKRNVTDTRLVGRTDGRSNGQRENSIPSNKHSLRGRGYKNGFHMTVSIFLYLIVFSFLFIEVVVKEAMDG